MKISNAIAVILIAGFLLFGCVSSNPSEKPDGSSGQSSSSPGMAKATLDSDENFTAVLSYNPSNREASIEAWQYLEAKRTGQLNFSCVLGSAFLRFINDPRLYGESGRSNGTYQVRIPPERYAQFVKNSGLSAEQFAGMNVTEVTLHYRSKENNASLGECVNVRGRMPTLDGNVIPTNQNG